MKYIISLFTALIFSNTVYSQTREKEVEYLDNAYKTGVITLTEYKNLAKLWSDLLTDIGEYPSLPYDENLDKIVFQYEKEYPYSSKVIYNRIKEWAAISFGSLNDVLHYENLESGKIILKGYFTIPYLEDVKVWFTDKESVNSARCSHTYIFTIVDNKLKINIINLNYEFNYYSYSASGFQSTFISTKDVSSLYPITKDKSMQWKSKLSLIQNTDKQINILVKSLDYYINSYESDYKF